MPVISKGGRLVSSNGKVFKSYDVDTSNFIVAAGITDSVQQEAIDTLVIGLKSNNLWSKMQAVYPFIGGTSSTHKFNLKDPRDLDAAYRLVFSGGLTHSSNGIEGNGSNGEANTFLNYSSLNSGHISLYNIKNTGAASYDMGAYGSYWIILSLYSSIVIGGFNGDSQPRPTISNDYGLWINNRVDSNKTNLWNNKTKLIETNDYPAVAIPNKPIYLWTINGATSLHSNRKFVFSSIGDGLTDTDALNLYIIVQQYQTTLGRQV